ncbi:uncharacterized protein LOC134297953 [Anolis carolinensis]|uniref:uncharacterized protein LOC134297953 n=1 Tax=Anolis carolinensis TaxID=28377 RepID=UPI002F2B51E3
MEIDPQDRGRCSSESISTDPIFGKIYQEGKKEGAKRPADQGEAAKAALIKEGRERGRRFSGPEKATLAPQQTGGNQTRPGRPPLSLTLASGAEEGLSTSPQAAGNLAGLPAHGTLRYVTYKRFPFLKGALATAHTNPALPSPEASALVRGGRKETRYERERERESEISRRHVVCVCIQECVLPWIPLLNHKDLACLPLPKELNRAKLGKIGHPYIISYRIKLWMPIIVLFMITGFQRVVQWVKPLCRLNC